MLDFLKKNKPFPFFQWSVYFFSVYVDTKASVLNVRIKELKAQGHTATEDNIKANKIPETLSQDCHGSQIVLWPCKDIFM